jgi:hypothetical protein
MDSAIPLLVMRTSDAYALDARVARQVSLRYAKFRSNIDKL